MKMFKEGNVEIPYENNHFDNEEDYYLKSIYDDHSMMYHSDDDYYFSNDGEIKHFQD